MSVEGNTATIGMDVCINTSAETDEEAKELLSLLGMPFRKSSSESEASENTETKEEAAAVASE